MKYYKDLELPKGGSYASGGTVGWEAGPTPTEIGTVPQAAAVQTRSTPGTADGGHDTQDSRRREGSRYGISVQRNQATRFAVCVSLAPIHLYAVRPHTTKLARVGSGWVHKEVVQASGTIPHSL